MLYYLPLFSPSFKRISFPPPSPFPLPLQTIFQFLFIVISQNWLPLGPQPDLVPRDTPPQMDRLPSIFATTMKPGSSPVTTPPEATLPEGEEFMEVDDPDTPICDNLVVRGRQFFKSICMVDYEGYPPFTPLIFLQNVRTFFGNTEPNCTYYEQYCIDNDYFRLGK